MTVPSSMGRPFLVDARLTQPPAHHREHRGDVEHAHVEHAHIVRVRVLGELDHSTAPVFNAELACAGRRGMAVSSWAASPALELDLSGLTFLDTGGLSALKRTRQQLAALGCRLCLTHPRPGVLRLLDLAVFSAWLPADVECEHGQPWAAVAQTIRPKTPRRSRRAWSPAGLAMRSLPQPRSQFPPSLPIEPNSSFHLWSNS